MEKFNNLNYIKIYNSIFYYNYNFLKERGVERKELSILWNYNKIPNSFLIDSESWKLEESKRLYEFNYWSRLYIDIDMGSKIISKSILSLIKDKLRDDVRSFIFLIYMFEKNLQNNQFLSIRGYQELYKLYDFYSNYINSNKEYSVYFLKQSSGFLNRYKNFENYLKINSLNSKFRLKNYFFFFDLNYFGNNFFDYFYFFHSDSQYVTLQHNYSSFNSYILGNLKNTYTNFLYKINFLKISFRSFLKNLFLKFFFYDFSKFFQEILLFRKNLVFDVYKFFEDYINKSLKNFSKNYFLKASSDVFQNEESDEEPLLIFSSLYYEDFFDTDFNISKEQLIFFSDYYLTLAYNYNFSFLKKDLDILNLNNFSNLEILLFFSQTEVLSSFSQILILEKSKKKLEFYRDHLYSNFFFLDSIFEFVNNSPNIKSSNNFLGKFEDLSSFKNSIQLNYSSVRNFFLEKISSYREHGNVIRYNNYLIFLNKYFLYFKNLKSNFFANNDDFFFIQLNNVQKFYNFFFYGSRNIIWLYKDYYLMELDFKNKFFKFYFNTVKGQSFQFFPFNNSNVDLNFNLMSLGDFDLRLKYNSKYLKYSTDFYYKINFIKNEEDFCFSDDKTFFKGKVLWLQFIKFYNKIILFFNNEKV